MFISSLLLKVRAIDWFIVESGCVRSQGALIYPPDVLKTWLNPSRPACHTWFLKYVVKSSREMKLCHLRHSFF